ncbi:MAG: Gfo/Idh/MocA family protein [Promethearchaeota archaeon]
MDPIKLGFVGGGPRSSGIYGTLIFNKSFENKIEPVALLDNNPAVLKEWSYKVDNVYQDLDQFLKNEDLDAVLIITPPATHAKFAVKCLELGLDTWSEVPMGLSINELFLIRDATRSNKGNSGRYALGENACWYLGIQFARKLAIEGKMGDLFYVEGEYHHSVEHYMIMENFKDGMALDPETNPETTPTWRATLPPIVYGHSAGPALYVVYAQDEKDRPVEVSAYGNMKMQTRFKTHNFQIGLFKTKNEVIGKFGSGFVLPNREIRHHLFWATKCYYKITLSEYNQYYLYLVPEDKKHYPERHSIKGRFLSENDIRDLGTRHAKIGGHGGSDALMFEDWLSSLYNKKKYPLDEIKGAEITAVGIIGNQSIIECKSLEIPDFNQ